MNGEKSKVKAQQIHSGEGCSLLQGYALPIHLSFYGVREEEIFRLLQAPFERH
jgi:hypothetical protein